MNKLPLTGEFYPIIRIERVVRGYMPEGHVKPSFEFRSTDMLGYIVSGEALYRYDDGMTVSARPGDVLYIPRGGRYTYDVLSPRYEYVYSDFVMEYPEGIEGTGASFASGKLSAYIKEKFDRLYETWVAEAPGYLQKCAAILYLIVSSVVYSNSSAYVSGAYRETAKRCAEEIKNNFQDPGFSISQLDSLSGCSSVHLRRIFRECFDMSPKEYLSHLRCENAKMLLRETGLSIEKIGELSGFDDPGYFSRFFTKLTGCAPGRYRRLFIQNTFSDADASERKDKND